MSGMTVEQVQAMVTQGMTDTEIGRAVGRERRTVQSFRAKHGIQSARPVGRNTRHLGLPVTTTDHPISVAEFLLNKRRAVCPVCQLKEPVKAMVMEAKKKGERQSDIIEYLRECHRVTVTPRDFSAHVSGRHDA